MNDRFSFLKSQIPKPLQYPVSPNAVSGARIIAWPCHKTKWNQVTRATPAFWSLFSFFLSF